MKTKLVLSCVFCASAAFGQNVAGAGAISAQPVPITFTSRSEHASQKPMGHEESILGSSSSAWAHGERPLWEFAPKTVEVPLGDRAREIRREHTLAKKSAKVFENQ
jgi:hypothetical protein